MLFPAVLGFLTCAVSLSSAAVTMENGMPMQWSKTVSQVTDFPSKDGVLTPNPWHLPHRMSFLRLMINATDPYMESMGPNATNSPVWGMPVLLGWLLTSGRLADPTIATTCGKEKGDPMCISPNSWWSCINYYSTALGFLSAAQKGFFGPGVQVQMQVPEGEVDYCTTYDDCAARFSDAVTAWDAFYQGLKDAKESSLPDAEKKDSLLGLYWTARTASILNATATCNSRLRHYSTREASFSKSWVDNVEYLAAVHYHSDLKTAEMFARPLPGRILKLSDRAPSILDMTKEENHSLYIFNWMDRINFMLGGSMVRLWRRAMCSVAAREKGREMMEQVLLNPAFATKTFISIITEMGVTC
ncbi:uncharacterized protein V6R79_016813 [Siganus canaliculatus]